MQASIESNKQEMNANKKDSDEKMTKFTEKFKAMLAAITDQIDTLKSSPTQSQLTEGLHNWTVYSIKKLVACGL